MRSLVKQYACLLLYFFFFSSRRRHTRLQGDWSSDVCSSDLQFMPRCQSGRISFSVCCHAKVVLQSWRANIDRKSTRLNSSHLVISYAVFCLKKKNKSEAGDGHSTW